MKNLIGGFLLGVVITVEVTVLPPVASWYSQVIYDCGIRVAAGATGGTIKDFTIAGHRIGVCIDSTGPVSVENTTHQDSETRIIGPARRWLGHIINL